MRGCVMWSDVCAFVDDAEFCFLLSATVALCTEKITTKERRSKSISKNVETLSFFFSTNLLATFSVVRFLNQIFQVNREFA